MSKIKRSVEIKLIYGKVTIESHDNSNGVVLISLENDTGTEPLSIYLSSQDVKILSNELSLWRTE